jgi:ribosomal protein S18 acetylase RimI-like enzyme
MLLLSSQPSPGATVATAAVARDATAIALSGGLSLVQMLLPPKDALRAAALRQAGFTSLALLHTMERSASKRPGTAPLPEDVRLLPCLDLPPQRVAQALTSTYIDTLDCPGLLGLRDPLDTLAGHRASGRPVLDCWCLVHHRGVDAGVLFVSEHTDIWDLIYVGLAPPSRGMGLGGAVLDTMLQRLHQHGPKCVRLCVDSKNEPAMHMYGARAFTTRATARALIATRQSMQVN